MNFFLPIFAFSACLCSSATPAAFSKPITIRKPATTPRQKQFSPVIASSRSDIYYPSMGSPNALSQLSMAYQLGGQLLPESDLYYKPEEDSGNSQ